ncbi:MAG: 23S rRNA (adenine(2503)-C(2))-methyltransferase RlmN [Candidatus Riflebacteria bacterium HGW-Riflebacteria-2]|jgi:23S rRNA (adenine2503-C2)-methyltransferase|nr:MAG: 23S rRNA (adenine(2503)-C(2))-methyltransferase RlmN [Candidatus Riflebacteria bacterium HGW-Riflebacteria-2]
MYFQKGKKMTAKSLFTCGLSELKKVLAEAGMPAFRASQIHEWIFKKFVFSFDEMTNISVADRARLKEAFPKILPPVQRFLKDSDGTCKVVLKLADEALIEAVAIPDEDSMTFCLSTQVGCAVGCLFCRTGESGFTRNLTSEEILLQVMVLVKRTGVKPTNIVFMGMGEPFYNRRALFEAIDMLTDPQGLAMATRRITISTAGVIEGIMELIERPGEVNLAVSLHVADDNGRNALVPINKRYPLARLKEAISTYCTSTSRRVTLEMVLLHNINDQYNDALNLVTFCEGLLVHINIVRFNHFPGAKYQPASAQNEKEFRRILKKAGIAVTVRKSRGQEILAACGQLAGKENG